LHPEKAYKATWRNYASPHLRAIYAMYTWCIISSVHEVPLRKYEWQVDVPKSEMF
jgi:hypothetical protein